MFVLAVIACGVIDYKKYIIPNAITIPLIVAGLLLQIYQQNWISILFALVAGTITLMLAAITGGMGGGDVKLITAFFLWATPVDTLNIIIISSIIGIIWGVVKKIRAVGWEKTKDGYISKAILWQAMGLKGLENHGLMRHDMVPFGTCMALGVVFYYMYVYMVWQHLK